MNHNNRTTYRACAQPGIAIGAILFVVAILAVLVGALAAGSNGFNASSGDEAAKTKGGALIEQAVIIKAAFDRLYGAGVTPEDLVVSPAYTDANRSLAFFGDGGLLPAAPPAGSVPNGGIDSWRFVSAANLPGIGVAGANNAVVAIGVATQTICQQMNIIIFGKETAQAATIPVAVSPSITLNDAAGCTDATMATTDASCNLSVNAFDISSIAGVSGHNAACIDDGSGHYYYYQLLLAQVEVTIMRFRHPGIAIGPILFIIAILAIIVAALASGSGSFNASTTVDRIRSDVRGQANLIRAKIQECYMTTMGNAGFDYPAGPTPGGTQAANLACPGDPSSAQNLWSGARPTALPVTPQGFNPWLYYNYNRGRCLLLVPIAAAATQSAVQTGINEMNKYFSPKEVFINSGGGGDWSLSIWLTPLDTPVKCGS